MTMLCQSFGGKLVQFSGPGVPFDALIKTGRIVFGEPGAKPRQLFDRQLLYRPLDVFDAAHIVSLAEPPPAENRPLAVSFH